MNNLENSRRLPALVIFGGTLPSSRLFSQGGAFEV